MFRLSAFTGLLAAVCLLVACTLSGCRLLNPADPTEEERLATLRSQLAPHLEVLGGRNWIVIADPAYPILAGEGVDVLTVDADTAETLSEVLDTLDEQGSLTPRLWLCSELDIVPEKRAPGIRRYRRELRSLLSGLLHYEVTDRIIALQLTQAAQTYRILYIKTTTHLPYSSIAIELDSGYWNSSDEAELRERMEKLNTPQQAKPLPQLKSSHYTQNAA